METRLATAMETTVAERLCAMGLSSELVTVVKNGVECKGMRIVNVEAPKISPVVYYNQEDSVTKRQSISTARIPAMPFLCSIFRLHSFLQ